MRTQTFCSLPSRYLKPAPTASELCEEASVPPRRKREALCSPLFPKATDRRPVGTAAFGKRLPARRDPRCGPRHVVSTTPGVSQGGARIPRAQLIPNPSHNSSRLNVQAVGGQHALRRLRACHPTRNPGCDTPLAYIYAEASRERAEERIRSSDRLLASRLQHQPAEGVRSLVRRLERVVRRQ
jgi:hypothetical protein